MHDNITNYDRVVSQRNFWYESKLRVEGTWQDLEVGEDHLISVSANSAVYAENNPSVGNCVSGEIDAEMLMLDDLATAAQSAKRGASIRWNQLCRIDKPTAMSALARYASGGNYYNDFSSNEADNATAGHKYLLRMIASNVQNMFRVELQYGHISSYFTLGGSEVYSALITANDERSLIVRGWSHTNGATMSARISVIVIDLTAMFGAGNEPTVSEMDALFMRDYYPYCTGINKTYDPTEIKRMAKVEPFIRAGAYINNVLTYSDWIPKGKYYVDTRSRTKNDDATDTMTLHGYDAMLMLEQPCYTTIPQSWNNVTMQTVLNHICEVTGLMVDSRTTINQTYLAQFPGVGEGAYTMREVLQMIGAANLGSWIINDYGKLQLIGLVNAVGLTNYLLAHTGTPLTFGGTRILLS